MLTHTVGIAALRDIAYVKKYAHEVMASTKLLARELPKLGFEVISTNAGLLLFRRGKTAPQKIQKKLEKYGVFVRNPFFKNLPLYLRMNVGNVAFTKKLIAKFKEAFQR